MQPRHGRDQRTAQFFRHGTLFARVALPRHVAVKDQPYIDTAVLGGDQGVHHAVLILALQFAEQNKQALIDRLARWISERIACCGR